MLKSPTKVSFVRIEGSRDETSEVRDKMGEKEDGGIVLMTLISVMGGYIDVR